MQTDEKLQNNDGVEERSRSAPCISRNIIIIFVRFVNQKCHFMVSCVCVCA